MVKIVNIVNVLDIIPAKHHHVGIVILSMLAF